MVLLSSLPGLLGNTAPDFDLSGVDDKIYRLESFASAQFLVVVFMCNHCPYVLAVLEELNQLADAFSSQGVQFVGINANDAQNYPADSFEKMKELGLHFPYLYDETQKTARDYEAVCTPDVFVYDSERTLVYHGRINDDPLGENEAHKSDLRWALTQLIDGKLVSDTQQVPSQGCSIKWK